MYSSKKSFIVHSLNCFSCVSRREQGNILLGSITVVLAVSITGAALMQTSLRTQTSSHYQQRQQHVFHMAESCMSSAQGHLRARTKALGNDLLPLTFSGNMQDLHRSNNTDIHKAKLSGYTMSCTLNGSPASGDAVAQSAITHYSQGEMVQSASGYGLSGDLSPKIYYWMDISADGPDQATKKINAVISARY